MLDSMSKVAQILATVSIGSVCNNAFSQRHVSTLQMKNPIYNRVTHRSWSIIKIIINSFIIDKEAQTSMTHIVKHRHSMKQTTFKKLS
jgi:hypothetical protein